jgi:hypothetical protein
LVKNDILQHDRERATPADSPPSPLSTAMRLAADWMAGIGFLRFHAAAYAVAGAALLLIDLILNPSDPWAVDLLRVWLILLGSHAVGLVAGRVTWRAIRPHRLVELHHVWHDADDAVPVVPIPAGPPRPLPATGRFTPGRIPPVVGDEDDQRWLSGALATIGDAVADLGDLTLAGWTRLRRGLGQLSDWIQGEDEDEDATATEPRPEQPASHHTPARWVVPTGSGRKGAAPGAVTPPDQAPAQRPPAPIVPLTPRPAKRREVSG